MFYLTDFHTWKTKIIPCDCENGYLRLSRQLKMQENIGTDQFDQCGLTFDTMTGNGFAFIIVNSASKYFRQPKENEEIVLTTMHECKKGVHFYRAYIFETLSGERLIESYNDFVLVDPDNHRIASPTLFDNICKYSDNAPQLSLKHPSKVRTSIELEKVGEMPVELKDIDFNHHLNNSVYWDFLQKFLPCDISQIDQIRMSYLAEGFKGDSMAIFRAEKDGKIYISGEHARGKSFVAEITLK